MGADGQKWRDDGQQDRRDLVIQIVTWGLAALALGLVFATTLYPDALAQTGPALFVLIALAPWVLLLMVFLGEGRYLLFGPDFHSVNVGVIVLPVLIGMSAITRFAMIDWRAPLVWALGMGMGFTALALMANASARAVRDYVVPTRRRGQSLVLPVVGCLLGWGTVIDANALAAPVAPTTQSEVIASKWVSGGKSRTHYVTFTQAPVPEMTDYEVSSRIYWHAHPGDRVCLVIHTGLLGWRWYAVRGAEACGDPVWGASATR